MFLSSIAYAAGGAPAAGGQAGGSSLLANIAPLILIFVIFYFLTVRRQQKKAKEHKAMLESLKPGDEVLTNGGIYGTVAGVDGEVLTINLGDTKVRINRNYISNLSAIKRQNEMRNAAKGARGKKGKDAAPAEPAAPAENTPADDSAPADAPQEKKD